MAKRSGLLSYRNTSSLLHIPVLPWQWTLNVKGKINSHHSAIVLIRDNNIGILSLGQRYVEHLASIISFNPLNLISYYYLHLASESAEA